jgi:uncharacterized membrane protein
MSERSLRGALLALSLAGAAIAGYILSTRYTGARLYCSTGGCETVQSSSYATLLGIPVAALGLAGYLAIGATALFRGPHAIAAGAAMAFAAVAFGAYLLVVQLVVIDAVCEWCLASDTVSTLVAIVAVLRFVRPGRTTAPPAAPPRARDGRARRGSRGGASA